MPDDFSSKLHLSVVLIAKNAERHLPRCLDSVKDIASEIIVVHNDCTDDTVKIAKEFGAKTVEQEWLGFRDQKNMALSHATQPWILSLDSDEELSSDIRQSIVQFVEKNDPQFNGAYFPRKVRFMGRWITHGTWYPDYSLRLLRQGCGRWTGEVIHEKLEVDGAVKKLNANLLHYPFRDMKDQLPDLLKRLGYEGYFTHQGQKLDFSAAPRYALP